jgi:hypothetical protein
LISPIAIIDASFFVLTARAMVTDSETIGDIAPASTKRTASITVVSMIVMPRSSCSRRNT